MYTNGYIYGNVGRIFSYNDVYHNIQNVELVSVRTQVVAGQNIIMKIKAEEGGVKKICDITVWSRPWVQGDEGFKTTRFDCQKRSVNIITRWFKSLWACVT